VSGVVRPSAFLWDSAQPRPEETAPTRLGGAWWAQYYGEVSASQNLSSAALQELAKSSSELAALLPDPTNWNRPPLFKGVVVGAVQSGKTQSMMGLVAASLDIGYRLVIVLAGLRDDLRTQTARRFNTQLMKQSDPIPGKRGATTLGGSPGLKGHVKGFAPPFSVDCHNYGPLLPKLQDAVARNVPSVIVIKKHPASLNDLGAVLRAIYAEHPGLPTLIVDDECDEATVPGSVDEKAVPSGIINLWGESKDPRVAYVGYTATAAATLLQHPNWALYPHWVYLLRYSGAFDTSWKFFEASSDKWYSGPECYFGDFGDEPGEYANFLINTAILDDELRAPVSSNASFQDALRAYLVGGAFRLTLNTQWSFDDPQHYPKPHTMLVHTSVMQGDHARWAKGIFESFGRAEHPDGQGLDPSKLSADLAANEIAWQHWYERFESSRERIYEERAHDSPHVVVTWEQVRKRLHLVFERTRVKVVNSDDGSSSLDYSQPKDAAGALLPPQDCFVIAIGGSRFSRGLTIEGLCISYFARHSTTRLDDVVMQMNRWFGYRGPYLEFCRVFTPPAGFMALKQVADNDLALRGQLAVLMNEKRSPADATIVFVASPYSMPTAKIGVGVRHDLSFSPFTKVLSAVETGSFANENEAWALRFLAQIRERNGFLVKRTSGVPRGFVSQGWSSLEIAALLEEWSFERHNPQPLPGLLEAAYRRPDNGRPILRRMKGQDDPYQVAAYLKYWCAMGAAPTFNVGFAFGELEDGNAPFDIPLLNREVTADDVAIGGWTGRGPNWRGDAFFDGVAPELVLEPNLRAAAAPGLLLFYVVHKHATGRNQQGCQRNVHTPFVGIAIPSGGPSFVRYLVGPEA
jgi:hypothetical protein